MPPVAPGALQGGIQHVIRALFICGKNRLRSPTAEQVFSAYPDVDTDSAGVNHDAECPVTPEHIDWADVIFVMERAHLGKLRQRFRSSLGKVRVICLDIPDDYDYMDERLVELLKLRVPPHLRQR
ncbi:MAG TPA: low molecular weight protein tyrosine phosphatase family protein [Luteibacter sp.]|nr:low molecular weight protein tyrosine phosphatase family protein [Luteibacter sp.]